MRMYHHSEFPVEAFPEIIRKNGTVNRAALKMRFSASGNPHANAEVAAAMIKAGYDVNVAFQLAILASQYGSKHGPSIDCMQRTVGMIMDCAELAHAKMHPHGKCAEDRAARLEGRSSRWGTVEFHRNPTTAAHYPAQDR